MNKNAVIIIDVQNGFVRGRTKLLPNKIKTYLEKNKFDYILFTKFINDRGSNFFKLLHWKKMLLGSETEICEELSDYVKKDNVFIKNNYSIFKIKKLTHYLRKNKIKSLYLCGVDLEACVLASAFEAFDRGYNVKVVSELSASNSGKYFHDAALKIIKRCINKI